MYTEHVHVSQMTKMSCMEYAQIVQSGCETMYILEIP